MAIPTMAPKEASERTEQVTFKVVPEWIDRADKLAKLLSRPGFDEITRTEVLRAALGRGLDALEEETPAPKRGKR